MKPEGCSNFGPRCECYERAPGVLNKIKIKDVSILVKAMRNLPIESDLYKRLLKVVKDIKGDWFVNNLDHGFCFWSYMKANNDKKHTLQECANLIGMSISAIANIERNALEKLRDSLDPEDFRK